MSENGDRRARYGAALKMPGNDEPAGSRLASESKQNDVHADRRGESRRRSTCWKRCRWRGDRPSCWRRMGSSQPGQGAAVGSERSAVHADAGRRAARAGLTRPRPKSFPAGRKRRALPQLACWLITQHGRVSSCVGPPPARVRRPSTPVAATRSSQRTFQLWTRIVPGRQRQRRMLGAGKAGAPTASRWRATPVDPRHDQTARYRRAAGRAADASPRCT